MSRVDTTCIIMWTKLGTHAYWSTKFSRLLQSSFWVVCYLHLCSQQYILLSIKNKSIFWVCDNNLNNDASLQYTTNHEVSCHLAVWCCVWHSENLLHLSTLRCTGPIASRFCAIIATHVLASIMSFEWHRREWQSSKLCLPPVYPKHQHDINVTGCFRP